MRRTLHAGLFALALALAGAAVQAQQPRPADPAARSAQSAAAAPRERAPEPSVQRAVIEDDRVRIEELRVRGQARRLVVQPKVEGARAYEIEPPDPGRDTTAARGASGQRVWRVFAF
ncbi:MAG: hypothetical protein HYZ20_16475 [Burkholderiales bacterium]|nr:hypothetical protein [Burkholderiales bacterium]